MANVSISEFERYILPDVSTCPPPLIEQAVRQAIIDFCERTWVFEGDCYDVYVEPEILEYEVEAPRHTEVEAILSVSMDGTAFSGYSYSPPTLTLTSEQDVAATLQIHAVLKPAIDAKEIDGVFLTQWLRAIVYAAKADLMDMQQKEWTNHDLANLYRRQYMALVGRAKLKKQNAYGQPGIAARPRSW